MSERSVLHHESPIEDCVFCEDGCIEKVGCDKIILKCDEE